MKIQQKMLFNCKLTFFSNKKKNNLQKKIIEPIITQVTVF